MRWFHWVLAVVLALGLSLAGWIYGSPVPFKNQVPLYGTLSTVSAAVFAVVGIWIGIIYPHVLSNCFRQDTLLAGKPEDEQRVFTLLMPVVTSSVVLIVAFTLPVVGSTLTAFELPMWIRVLGRVGSLAVLIFATIVQAIAVLECLMPIEALASQIKSRQRRRDLLTRHTTGTRAA